MEQSDVDRLEEKMDRLLNILHGGDSGDMGLVQKVSIIWTLVVRWPLYTASALCGAALTILVQKLLR